MTRVSGRAAVAGVVGWPVEHSLSPLIHGAWLRAAGIDGVYAPFAVAPERFDAFVEGLRGAGVGRPSGAGAGPAEAARGGSEVTTADHFCAGAAGAGGAAEAAGLGGVGATGPGAAGLGPRITTDSPSL